MLLFWSVVVGVAIWFNYPQYKRWQEEHGDWIAGAFSLRVFQPIIIIALFLVALYEGITGFHVFGIALVVVGAWLVSVWMIRQGMAEKAIANREAPFKTFHEALKVPKSFKEPLTFIFQDYATQYGNTRQIDPVFMAENVNRVFELASPLLVHREGGTPLGDFIANKFRSTPDNEYLGFIELQQMANAVKAIPVAFAIPDHLRNEHHMIVGGIGHGKSSTLISLFLDDLKEDASMVLIDSQGDLIDALATRVPPDRLILISPDNPPAMNVFDVPDHNHDTIADRLEILNYVFASGGMSMTAKQRTVYDYLAQLCMHIPGATIRTFRELLKPENFPKYAHHVPKLGEDAVAFFEEFNATSRNQYGETRGEVTTRFANLMKNPFFASMFTAPDMKLDIPEALEEGKVILVDTRSSKLKDVSPILGRLFIALTLQTVIAREKNNRKRVYLYCDEFKDYADDSEMLTKCFSQGRKYNLAMVVCFQILKALPETIRMFIIECTSIKFAGGMKGESATYIAKHMGVDEYEVTRQTKFSFLAYMKGYGTIDWVVNPKRIDSIVPYQTLREATATSKRLYGVEDKAPDAPKEDEPEGW